jgi:hypothetical protein
MRLLNRLRFALVFAVISVVVAFAAQTPKPGFQPKDGFVPDAQTAIKIAVAVWEPIYGAEKIAGEKPYRARLANGIWTVEGSLPARQVGGAAIAEIAKDDGRILRVIHEQ